MYQYGRVASSRRKIRLGHWLGVASLFAVCAPLGCAVYEPSMQPSDDVAGLQADAGAAGDPAVGGSGGLAGGGRAGSASGSAGASMTSGGAPAGGANGGSPAGGASAGGANGGMPAGGANGGMPAGGAPASHSGGASGAGVGGAGAGGAGAGGAYTTGGQGGAATTAGGGSGGSSSSPVVELAHGKSVIASSEQVGNEAQRGNDTSLTTRWCALHGTFPQWWRVDLGANHALHDFSVKFEHGDRKYSYKIETSNDDAVYTVQSTINGIGDEQSDTFAGGVSGRYVRITVTSAEPFVDTTSHPTWASFWDFRVNGS